MGYSFCGWCDAYISSHSFGFIFDSVSARWIILGFQLFPVLLLVVDEEVNDFSR